MLLMYRLSDVLKNIQKLLCISLFLLFNRLSSVRAIVFFQAKHIYVEATKYTVPSLLKSRKVGQLLWLLFSD